MLDWEKGKDTDIQSWRPSRVIWRAKLSIGDLTISEHWLFEERRTADAPKEKVWFNKALHLETAPVRIEAYSFCLWSDTDTIDGKDLFTDTPISDTELQDKAEEWVADIFIKNLKALGKWTGA
jgi:hypothetical protein